MGTVLRTPTYFEDGGLHFISPTLRFWIPAGAGMTSITKAEASFTRRKDASLGSLFV